MNESANESIQIFIVKMNGKALEAFYSMNEVVGFVKEQVTDWFTFSQPFYQSEKPLDDLLEDAERELLANNRYEVLNRRLEHPLATNINDLPEIAYSLFEVVPLRLSHYKSELPKAEPKEEEPKEEPKISVPNYAIKETKRENGTKELVAEISVDKETVEKVRMALVSDDMETYLGAKEDFCVCYIEFGDGVDACLCVQPRIVDEDDNHIDWGIFVQAEWYYKKREKFCETQLEVGDNNIVREYTPSDEANLNMHKLVVKLKED